MKRSNLFPPENHILEVKKGGKNVQPDVATWMMDLDALFSKKNLARYVFACSWKCV
jgi:hypothetical protein